MLRLAAPILSLCLVAGCLDDPSANLTYYAPMLLTADPGVFLGSVRCGSELKKYVVTLTDVTGGVIETAGSSPPTDCTKLTTFGRPTIQSLHFYVADIDGYDTDDIAPASDADGGTRQVIDTTTMAPVLRRWTTTCGEYALTPADAQPSDAQPNPIRYPTLTLDAVEVFLHGCLPMRPAPPPEAGPEAEPEASPDGADEPADDAAGG
jgi:hypothetical protein